MILVTRRIKIKQDNNLLKEFRVRCETRTTIGNFRAGRDFTKGRLSTQPACTRESGAAKWPPRTLSHLPLQVAKLQLRGAARTRTYAAQIKARQALLTFGAGQLSHARCLSLFLVRQRCGCGFLASLSLSLSLSLSQIGRAHV